jgi:hypothetical protein
LRGSNNCSYDEIYFERVAQILFIFHDVVIYLSETPGIGANVPLAAAGNDQIDYRILSLES